jgi:lipopolysaccharide biosynthesis glycosyltransferase
MKLKLIQAVSNREFGPGTEVGGYPEFIAECIYPLHSRFAERHGYAYEIDTSVQDFHPFWMKAYMMLKAIREGFDKIVWLDGDAIWLGDSLNPQFDSVFGATYHETYWYPNYFNAGVLYVNVNERSEQVIQSWFDERVNHFNDQEVLNANLREHITPIGWEWNCHIWIPHYRVDNPKVVAWHGCPDRIATMRRYLSSNPSLGPLP